MHIIQFEACHLDKTRAMYLAHHSQVPVTEVNCGMIVEYTELKRHYLLYLPDFDPPIPAEDSAEIVSITLEHGTPERQRLIEFLEQSQIPYGAINVIDPASRH